jgi:tryptophan-rich sensory protein
MTMIRRSNLLSLMVALVLPVLGGVAVGMVTGRSVKTWYSTLKKPAWNPPNWIFAPAWTLLYGMMGLASWLVWRSQPDRKAGAPDALSWYGLQLGLNYLWSIIFFGFRLPGLALLEIGVLWGTIMVTLIKFARINGLAMGLLVPYQLWVTFAAALNAAVWQLNREK